MIDRQYSPSVAAAQEGAKIESVYRTIRTAFLENNLPTPLKNLGLQYLVIDELIYAELHGFRVRVRYDHVWLKDGLPVPRLGGRLRFISVTFDGKDGDELLRVVFDHLGNVRVGAQNGYFSSASDRDDVTLLLRTMSLALANEIHAKMVVIDD